MFIGQQIQAFLHDKKRNSSERVSHEYDGPLKLHRKKTLRKKKLSGERTKTKPTNERKHAKRIERKRKASSQAIGDDDWERLPLSHMIRRQPHAGNLVADDFEHRPLFSLRRNPWPAPPHHAPAPLADPAPIIVQPQIPIRRLDPVFDKGQECEVLTRRVRSASQTQELRNRVTDILRASSGRSVKTAADISMDLLTEMLRAYDLVFFGGTLVDQMAAYGAALNVRVHGQGGKSGIAGTCQFSRADKCVVITIYTRVFADLFTKSETSHHSNGILCRSLLECVQNVFEHELVHAILSVFCNIFDAAREAGKKRTIHHPALFRKIALVQFGHTDYRHSLLNGDGHDVMRKRDNENWFKANLLKGHRIRLNDGRTGIVLLKPQQRASVRRVSVRIDGDPPGRTWKVPFAFIKGLI